MVLGVIVVTIAAFWGFVLRTLLRHEHRITKLEQKPDRNENTAGR